MEKPAVLQMGEYPDWDQDPMDAAYDMLPIFSASDKTSYLQEVGPRVRAIATRGDLGASKEVIDACPNLEIISVYGVGYDAVDVAACRARNIPITNTPGVLTGDVADLAVAMMLCQGRKMTGAEKWARDGSWVAKGGFPLTHRVHEAKAGILGLGRIGTEVGKRLAGFGMDIAYSSRSEKDDAPDWTFIKDAVELARHSDFLFVTLAASAETKHIVNKDVLEALGPDGMVINVSRAAIIDEEAMLDALENGTLGSAALDVFEGEPNINPRFLSLDNVLLQPHAGSGTYETRKSMGKMMRDNLTAHFSGQPLLTEIE